MGYCCRSGVDVGAECQTQCTPILTTSNQNASQLAISNTFHPGLQTNHFEMCGAELQLIADSTLKQNATVAIPSSSYACEYRISIPALKYRTSSQILLWLEGTYHTNVYFYSGNSRTNLTTLIENNQTASIGAPIGVPVDDGIVIIV